MQISGVIEDRRSIILEDLSDISASISEALIVKINSQGDIDILKKWSRILRRATSIEQLEKDTEETSKNN